MSHHFKFVSKSVKSITYPLKLPMGVLAPDTKTTSFMHLFDEVVNVLNEILPKVAMFVLFITKVSFLVSQLNGPWLKFFYILFCCYLSADIGKFKSGKFKK